LPSASKGGTSAGQLAQSMPGNTITTGTSGTGMSITANAYVSMQWQQVSSWSNQGGIQQAQSPIWQSPTDEDGDEIPSMRIRLLKPNHQYRAQDGSEIEVDGVGNYVVKDEAARITYRASRMRDFNRFVNGSDLVGEFIEALGSLGANQEQAAGANLEMFIRWLVHKAAEHDKEAPPEDVPPVTIPPPPPERLPRVGDNPEVMPPFIIDEQSVRVAELVTT
jgi:hypothetical protein